MNENIPVAFHKSSRLTSSKFADQTPLLSQEKINKIINIQKRKEYKIHEQISKKNVSFHLGFPASIGEKKLIINMINQHVMLGQFQKT